MPVLSQIIQEAAIVEKSKVSWKADEESIGLRLDQAATLYLEDFSRSRIARAIQSGEILLNGAPSKSSVPVKEGDQISVDLRSLKIAPILPDPIPLDILYQDDDILVINKAAGMIVHPTLKVREKTLVNALLGMNVPLSQVNGSERPGIVHRLDAQTSGALVIAKNDPAHLRLAEDLKERKVSKIYLAICQGKWDVHGLFISLPIGRNPKNPQKRTVLESGGKEAVTIATTLSSGKEASLLSMQILTGRTHQIRVHARAMGHPVVGDGLYGYKKEPHHPAHQLLHSYFLSFNHPGTGEKLEFFAPWDQEFERMAKIYSLELPKMGDPAFVSPYNERNSL